MATALSRLLTPSTVIAAALMICAMAVRPTFLGDSYSVFGSFAVLGVGVASWALLGFAGRDRYPLLLSFGSVVALWLFLTVQSALNGVPSYFPVSALVQCSAVAGGAMLCFSNRAVHDKFFAYFRLFMTVCAISALVTIALSAVVGLGPLILTTLTSKNYDGVSALYFPFTQGYGAKMNFGIAMPRAAAGFREAGIAQAFFAMAILSKPRLRSARDWLMLALLFLGGLAAQSTTGLAIVAIALAIRLVRLEGIHLAFRAILIAAAVGFSLFAFDVAMNDPSVGFASKVQTDSYLDRYNQVQRGLQAFRDNPLGYGLYNGQSGGGNINLIASLGGIGIFGALLVLTNWLCSVLGSYDRWGKLFFMLPLIFTSLTSQPLLDAGLVYLFFAYLAPPLPAPARRAARARPPLRAPLGPRPSGPRGRPA